MRNACMEEYCAISRIFWNKITESLFANFVVTTAPVEDDHLAIAGIIAIATFPH